MVNAACEIYLHVFFSSLIYLCVLSQSWRADLTVLPQSVTQSCSAKRHQGSTGLKATVQSGVRALLSYFSKLDTQSPSSHFSLSRPCKTGAAGGRDAIYRRHDGCRDWPFTERGNEIDLQIVRQEGRKEGVGSSRCKWFLCLSPDGTVAGVI